MPAFVILDSISLTTPDGRPLFDGLTLAQERERTGIVGRNGSGKSTLLRLIRGEVEPAGGSVQRIGSIGMLTQLADERETIAQALRVADDLASSPPARSRRRFTRRCRRGRLDAGNEATGGAC